jgi:hypothetical protein
MSTVLFTPCFLEGKDALGNSRYDRNIRYVDYYSKIQGDLGIDALAMADNASPYSLMRSFLYHVEGKRFMKGSWFHYEERLTGGGGYNYPYCWRALYALKELLNDFYKIVIIDSDGFILSKRLAHYVRDLDTGWSTLWCNKWQFPESSFQVICRDAYPILKDFCDGDDYMKHNGKCMENVLPFTFVNKDFDSDRYGEDRVPQRDGMDFYSQAPLDIPLEYK